MKALESIPVASGSLPLVGHLPHLMRDPYTFVKSLAEHDGLVQIRIATKPIVLVCSPDLTREVLLDDRTFDKGGPIIDRIREFLGNGLATCAHKDHRRQRRAIQPVFRSERFAGYIDVMNEQIAAVTETWADGQILDVQHEMEVITSRVLTNAMFSNAISSDRRARIIELIEFVMAAATRRTITPPALLRLPTPANRRFDEINRQLRTLLEEIVVERRVSGNDYGDFLSALLTAEAAEGESAGCENRGLTNAEVVDQLVTIFIAGTETVAGSLSWALYVVAGRPDLQDRLHDEVDSVPADSHPGHERLRELKLTSGIITETLRLHSPAWIFARVVTVDTELGGHHLPAGTSVAYCPHLIHRRSDTYDDADRFDPDRWIDGAKSDRRNLIMFGAGARKCIGDVFGQTEAMLAFAGIFARWQVELVPDAPLVLKPALALSPTGLRLRVRARTALGTRAS
ncbi:cytochrome P450 [Nocardia sp. CNY236]|uniref:cytochrome P450 n=1 Tax=Nocardia sp. CNY236 TaxID=1169152 RepID=UPI0003FBC512|nr:cytochrome P450 [Nocardia sp. CNY236]